MPETPVVENIHQKIFEAVSKENALNMQVWHADEKIENGAHCGTTHCLAGWIITLAGSQGRRLEKVMGTPHAALMIARKSSDIPLSPNRFYETNEQAMAGIKHRAEQEAALKK